MSGHQKRHQQHAAVTPVANPDLAGGCGIDINLVIDRSGSIGSNSTVVHNAVRSMVDALTGTGSPSRSSASRRPRRR